VNKIASYISGLDEMLNGGLPAERSILVLGGPGSGKTCFGLQFLLNGINLSNENGLFISLEESKKHLTEDAAGFNWNLEKLEAQKKLAIIDASPVRKTKELDSPDLNLGSQGFNMQTLAETIESAAEEINAQRLVIDAIANLTVQYPYSFERRIAVLELLDSISRIGSTNIITSESRATNQTRNVSTIEFLCHGVIVFHSYREGNHLVKAIQIEKMRGMAHDEQIRPYRITNKGIVVYSNEDSVEIPTEIFSRAQ
jgi:KaiC/GvpD/RAD55 family RecA-like ATPase